MLKLQQPISMGLWWWSWCISCFFVVAMLMPIITETAISSSARSSSSLSSSSSSSSSSHKSREMPTPISSSSSAILGDDAPLMQQQSAASVGVQQQQHHHQAHHNHRNHRHQQRGKNRDMSMISAAAAIIESSNSDISSEVAQMSELLEMENMRELEEHQNTGSDITVASSGTDARGGQVQGTTTTNNNNNNNKSEQQEQQLQFGQNGNNGNYDRPYIASNCSRCRMLEETINLTKEAIKQQILSKLGFKQAPNITGRALPRIPPLNHLLDMYGMQSDAPGQVFKPGPVYEEAEDDYHAKTEKVISFAQEPPASWSLPSTMEVQYFKFSHSVMVNKVVRANLWVFLNPSKAVQDVGTLVHVYKVSRTEGSTNSVMTHVLSSKVDFKSRKGGWVAVEIRKLAFDWFRHPQNNLGIVVQAFDQEGVQLVSNGRHEDSDTSLVPFVEVYTMDESKRRTKRMIGLNCEENSNEVRCCRYPLTVDFEEFGWDWIIAPKKYEANYCSGECPFVFLQKYPHTHLVQQANPSGSAGPCCAPRKMSPISMLYFDNEYNIIYGLLPGMVVDRCSCS